MVKSSTEWCTARVVSSLSPTFLSFIIDTRHRAAVTKTVCLCYHPTVFLMPMYIILLSMSENQSQPRQHDFSKSTTLSIWRVYGQWSHKRSKWRHVTALLPGEGQTSWLGPLSIPTATVLRIFMYHCSNSPTLRVIEHPVHESWTFRPSIANR